MPTCLHEAGPLEIIASFKMMTDVFIHHEGQFQDPNSRVRANVAKGQFQKIAIIHEVVKQLGIHKNFQYFVSTIVHRTIN